MHYCPDPNLLIEALACLGRCANGHTWDRMEEQLKRKNIVSTELFTQTLEQLKSLTARLDPLGILRDTGAMEDFRNLEGFPRNTVGTASPAFFVFYGLLERWHGDFRNLKDYVSALTPDQTAYHLALALNLADDQLQGSIPVPSFLNMVLAQSLPDSSKIAILNLFRDLPGALARMIGPVESVLTGIAREQEQLNQLCSILGEKIGSEGYEAYLSRTSRLILAPGCSYRLRPFLFGMDTNLSSPMSDGGSCIYCGILREEMLGMLSGQSNERDLVYEALRLLGDRTRFDMVCYLRDHEAYGQELSARFGISRNTVHHHMSKLSAAGLVRCTTSGNRVYYTLDRDMVQRLLQLQRNLFFQEG